MPIPASRAPAYSPPRPPATIPPEDQDEETQAPGVVRPRTPQPEAAAPVGTTGGIIPQQAGTWDALPAARLSDNPDVRRQQSLDAAQEQFAAKQRADNPFIFSNDIKSLAKEGGRRYTDAAVASGERQYQDQLRQDKQQAAQDVAAYNSQALAKFKGSGQQYYEDPLTKKLTPVLEEGTNRPLFHATEWEETVHPKTGVPTLMKRDQYGQRQFRDLPVVPGLDPTDEQMYYKSRDGTLTPAGRIQDMIGSPNYMVARTALAANKNRVKALHQEAITPLKESLDALNEQYGQAQTTRDGINQQIAGLQAQLGQTDDPAQIDAINASVGQLQGQLEQVNGQLSPKKGSLSAQLNDAKRTYYNAQRRQVRDLYAAQIAERAAILRHEGADPSKDANLQYQQQQLEQLNQGLEADGAQSAPVLGAGHGANVPGAPATPAAPTSKPALENALQNAEPSQLAARGVKNIGTQSVDALTKKYGDGSGAIQPDSVLRIDRDIKGIDSMLGDDSTNISQKIRAAKQQERDYLSNLYAQRVARLTPEQQDRVKEATRTPGLWDIAKGAIKSAAGAAAEGGASVLKGASLIPNSPADLTRKMAESQLPGEARMEAMKSDPLYQLGDLVSESAKEFYAKNPHENEGAVSKALNAAAEAAGGFAPLVASGPAAPLTIGLQTAGADLQSNYDRMIAAGKSPDVAANFAVKRALANGAMQSALFELLPPALQKAGNKYIVDKIAGGALSKFLANRVAQAAEGAVVGGVTSAAGNVASDRPVGEGVTDAMTGLALAQAGMPRAARGASEGKAAPDLKEKMAAKLAAEAAPGVAAEAGTPQPERPGLVQEPTTPAQKSALAIHEGLKAEEKLRRSPEGAIALKEDLAAQQARVDDFYKARTEEGSQSKADELRAVLQGNQVNGPSVRTDISDAANAAFEKLDALDAKHGVGVGATKERARQIDIIEAARAAHEASKSTPPPEEPGAQPAAKGPTPPAPAPQAKNPSLEEDIASYQQAQKDMLAAVKAGDKNALQEAWQRNEDIKNRHGGMPPGEGSAESAPAKLEPAPAYYRGVPNAGAPDGTDRFYSADREVAENYAGQRGGGDEGVVTEHKFDEFPKKLYDAVDKESLAEELGITVHPTDFKFDAAVKAALKKQGYEGIRYSNGTFDAEEIHVFGKESTPATRLADVKKRRAARAATLGQEPAETSAAAGGAAQEKTGPSKEVVNAPTQPVEPRAPIQLGESMDAAIERLAANGETALSIAARVNSNVETVRKIAMKNGIAIAEKSKVKPDIVMAPRSAEQRLNDADLGMKPVAMMTRAEKRAELDAAGIKTYNGKPLDEANPAEISNAVGKLRKGELTAEGEKPGAENQPRASDRLIEALQRAKIHKPGDVSVATPLSLAHDAALDLAIVGIKAGRAVADVVKLAVQRFKAKYPGATEEDVAKLEKVIREAHEEVNGPPPKGGSPVAKSKSLLESLGKKWGEIKSESDLKDTLAATRDAVEGKANQYAAESKSEISEALNRAEPDKALRKTADSALRFFIEADNGNKEQLAEMRKKVEQSTKADPKWKAEALKAIDYASENGAKLKDVAERYRRIMNEQLGSEEQAGLPTMERKNYVPRYQDVEDGSWLEPKKGGMSMGSGNRKNRTFETAADALAAGIDPKTLSATDSLTKRVQAGMNAVHMRAWEKSLFNVQDPTTGAPLAAKPERVERADGSYYYQAPKGYNLEKVGNVPVSVKKEYAGTVSALTDPSWFSQNKALIAAQKANAFAKSMTLLVDTYHLGRLAFRSAMINASHTKDFKLGPRYSEGLLLADHSPQEISQMAERGEIPKEKLPEYLEQKKTLDKMVDAGYNMGRVADNMHQELVQKIPLLSDVNKFIFQKFQRGAMSDAAILEYKRQRADYPDLTDEQVAQKVSRELMTRFGNLGRQGWFKSKTAQDIMRTMFLAPQWNEGLIRSELGGAKDIAKSALNLAQGKRSAMGLLGREMLTTGISLFVANQIINQTTRGKFTWENPEEGWGSKISAWIPDKLGGSSGFFLNPMGLTAETAHLLLNSYGKAGNTYQPLIDYGRSRASSIMRPALTFLLGKDALNRNIKPDERWKATAEDAIPTPISAGSIARVGKGLATGGKTEKYPGEFEKQALQSAGIRTEKAPSPEQRIQGLAHEYMKKINPNAKEPTGEVSDYQELTDSLRRGNEEDTKDAIETLLQKRNADDLAKYYRQWSSRPFAGSYKAEAEFLRTLNPEQREQYSKARAERRRLADMAQRAISRIPANKRAGPFALKP